MALRMIVSHPKVMIRNLWGGIQNARCLERSVAVTTVAIVVMLEVAPELSILWVSFIGL